MGVLAPPADKTPRRVSRTWAIPDAEVFLEPVSVGDDLPKMPLFLNHEAYVLLIPVGRGLPFCLGGGACHLEGGTGWRQAGRERSQQGPLKPAMREKTRAFHAS